MILLAAVLNLLPNPGDWTLWFVPPVLLALGLLHSVLPTLAPATFLLPMGPSRKARTAPLPSLTGSWVKAGGLQVHKLVVQKPESKCLKVRGSTEKDGLCLPTRLT